MHLADPWHLNRKDDNPDEVTSLTVTFREALPTRLTHHDFLADTWPLSDTRVITTIIFAGLTIEYVRSHKFLFLFFSRRRRIR